MVGVTQRMLTAYAARPKRDGLLLSAGVRREAAAGVSTTPLGTQLVLV
jgi:hypothetical protein